MHGKKNAGCVSCCTADLAIQPRWPERRRAPRGKIHDVADMFERYSERARGAVVIARIEACQLCAPSIDTEHLLLGAANADLECLNRFLAFEVSEQSRAIRFLRMQRNGGGLLG